MISISMLIEIHSMLLIQKSCFNPVGLSQLQLNAKKMLNELRAIVLLHHHIHGQSSMALKESYHNVWCYALKSWLVVGTKLWIIHFYSEPFDCRVNTEGKFLYISLDY